MHALAYPSWELESIIIPDGPIMWWREKKKLDGTDWMSMRSLGICPKEINVPSLPIYSVKRVRINIYSASVIIN